MQLGVELKKLFERDLTRLEKEVNLYQNQEDLWHISGEISNSSGNLALHLCGNLKHFIGAILAKTGYVRNRPFEFSGKVSIQNLNSEIEETKEVVVGYLDHISEVELEEEFPLQPLGYSMTVSEFLFHLYGHLNYHLGQVNYHRRLINSK